MKREGGAPPIQEVGGCLGFLLYTSSLHRTLKSQFWNGIKSTVKKEGSCLASTGHRMGKHDKDAKTKCHQQHVALFFAESYLGLCFQAETK